MQISTSYGATAKVLHWLIAAILIGQLVYRDEVMRRMLPGRAG